MAGNMEGIVCLHHPNTQAVARCSVCRTPLCADCIKRKNGNIYCSKECMDSGEESISKYNRMQASKSRGESIALVRKIIWLIILAALCFAGWYFRKPIMDLFNKGKDAAGKAKQQIEQGYDQKIQRTQRKNHGQVYDELNQ